MTDAQVLCEFKPPKNFGDPNYQCRHPARQDGLCIFHLFKHTEEQKQAMAQEARRTAGMIEEEFCQAFSKLLEDEEENPEADVCDFSYFRFPSIDLSRLRFAKPLLLERATFNGEAGFGGAAFSGGTTFNGEAGGFGNAGFHGAVFNGGLTFMEPSSVERPTLGKPSSTGGLTFMEPSSTGRLAFMEPSSVERPTLGKPPSVERPAFGKPSSVERPALMEPPSVERPTFGKPSSVDGPSL
jgi:hypothetical protein